MKSKDAMGSTGDGWCSVVLDTPEVDVEVESRGKGFATAVALHRVVVAVVASVDIVEGLVLESDLAVLAVVGIGGATLGSRDLLKENLALSWGFKNTRGAPHTKEKPKRGGHGTALLAAP